MVIIVYIGMFIYGLYSGYISSMNLDDENEVIALQVFIAMVASTSALIFAHFAHIFSVFFLWLLVTFITSEVLKFIRNR